MCLCVCACMCSVSFRKLFKKGKIVAQQSNGGDMSCLVYIIQYASKKMTPTFGTLFRNAFAAQLVPQIRRLLPRIEGFSRRALGSYTHRFPKHGAASLTDLLGLSLCLLELHLCLPSCVCNGKQNSNGKVSPNMHHF